MDEGRWVHTAFLVLAKAFDEVDHKLLLDKLPSFGLINRALSSVLFSLEYMKGCLYRCKALQMYRGESKD